MGDPILSDETTVLSQIVRLDVYVKKPSNAYSDKKEKDCVQRKISKWFRGEIVYFLNNKFEVLN